MRKVSHLGRCRRRSQQMRRCLRIAVVSTVFFVSGSAYALNERERHQDGFCVMYGQCGPKTDSWFAPQLNCPANIVAPIVFLIDSIYSRCF